MSEVAHDHQVQVKKYVVDELCLKNSSDTWHGELLLSVYVVINFHTLSLNAGTKGVAKAMKKIAQGPSYKEGVTWFQQLADKRMWNSCSLDCGYM